MLMLQSQRWIRALKLILLPCMHTLQHSLQLQAETDSWGSRFQKQSVPQSPLPIKRLNCRKEFHNDCNPGLRYIQHTVLTEFRFQILINLYEACKDLSCFWNISIFFPIKYSSITWQKPAFQNRGSKALPILDVLFINISEVFYSSWCLFSNCLHIIAKIITSLATDRQNYMENFRSSCCKEEILSCATGF